MECKIINGIELTVNGKITDEELTIYLNQLQSKGKYKIIKADVTVDGEYIDINSTIEQVPFERIRRITGYLVGTTSKWNDAKQAELKDRVTHG